MTDVSSDIYGLTKYVEDIKSKYIDEDEITQSMGMYGYLSEVITSIMQNSIVMSSEYSNEAIPVKAKFEKNIIAHALSLGIKTNATPASMNVLLVIPEDYLNINMKDNKFTFDKNVKIMVGDYEYHLDYDIVILKTTLPTTGEYIYTAQYNIDRTNALSDITNPYLQSIARLKLTNYNCIAVSCKIRQVEYSQVYKKIISDNPLDNKIINFTFDSQLASFDLEVVENGTTYHITPVYDGLYDASAEYYCNYSYINSNTIRVKFNEDSYYPSMNCDVTINLYTTKGSEANFTYTSDIIISAESDRFNYDRLTVLIKQTDGKSTYGIDKKSISDLKRIIPKEALSRGSVTNSTDLNNYFNSINDTTCQLNFFKKIDNPLERLYYAYLLLRYDNVVIPTNTINVSLIRKDFDSVKNDNYVFNTGNAIFYRRGISGTVKTGLTDALITNYEDIGFLYFNPFTCIINKSPFYVSYYLTVLNTNRYLSFDFTNENSQVQFISTTINWKREFFTDRNKYKLSIDIMQNISADMDLVTRDSLGNITGTDKVKVGLLLYNLNNEPYKYAWGTYSSYDQSNYIFTFTFELETDNTYDGETSRIKINNLIDLATTTANYGYLSQNTKAKIFVFVKNDSEGGRDDSDLYFAGMDGWTLSNTYSVFNGLDFFYNYSHIISSTITVSQNSDSSLSYYIEKMPVLRYTYVNSETKMLNFVNELEIRRNYIEDCLNVLEDSFGIDFKFYNTYGPSTLFYINDDTVIDKTNISLKFKVRFASITDKHVKDYIIQDIKDYIEDLEDGIKDLHMPNLITQITTTYRDQLVYFEFVEFNDYGTSYQHIYRPDTDLIGKIPEFLNVNSTSDGTPDITLEVVQS